MNILFCSPLRGSKGNYPVHVYEVLTNLEKLGHRIIFPGGNRLEGEQNIDSNLQKPSLLGRAKSALGSSRILRPFKGEIYLLVSLWNEACLFCSVLSILIKHRKEIDVIYRRHALYHSEYFLARMFRVPSVQEVNGIEIDLAKHAQRGDRISLWLLDRIERYFFPKADKIIAITPKLEKVLTHDYHVPQHRVVVVQNGANTDLFKPMDALAARKRLNLKQSDNCVCMAGSFVRYQGHEYLIKSAPLVLAKNPNTRFLLIGDGETREGLMELARQMECSDRITFTGSVPYERVTLYLGAADVCVAPKKPLLSGYSPQSLYEYMACGRPVVATRTDGFEILEQHNAGLLVNPEDAEELARAIVSLLQAPQLRKEIGENARKYVVENHNWKIVATGVAAVCQQAIQEYKKTPPNRTETA
ncbi:glycosyltransferase family 4 protein [Chloroflexota bacterium]